MFWPSESRHFLYHYLAQKRRFKSESIICSIFLLPCLRRYFCLIQISLGWSEPNFTGAFSSFTFLLHQGRLGAVACLQLAVKHFKIEDHVLVIGGWVYRVNIINQLPTRVVTAAKSRPDFSLNSDTLFKEDFSLSKVKERFSDIQEKSEDSCLVLSYHCKDEGEFFKQPNWRNVTLLELYWRAGSKSQPKMPNMAWPHAHS